MKLYYKPGACSLAVHIMLKEVGAPFEIEEVDTEAGKTKTGRDYKEINPNGYVPTLEIDSGDYITEGIAILQYIADNYPARAFSPALGSLARARLQQFLNFAATELHKSWTPLFTEGSSDAQKAEAARNVASKFDYLDSVLADGRAFLVENQFSVADAYSFVLASWASVKNIDLDQWPHLARLVAQVRTRPATIAALRAEGLLK